MEPEGSRAARKLSPPLRSETTSQAKEVESEDEVFEDHSVLLNGVRSVMAGSSKMDKYFDANYDPRLDVSVDDLTDGRTGFIAEGNFDEWSDMLERMKLQKEFRQEKAERQK